MPPPNRRQLTVDTDINESTTRSYELTQTPSIRKQSVETNRTSLHTTVQGDVIDVEKQQQEPQEEPPATPSPPYGPQPSLRLLFSLISQRDVYTLLLPAIATSIIAGGVAPFMTHVVGQVFDAFAEFPLTGATSQEKSTLRHDVGIAAVELVALAAGAIALGSITSALWIATGERNVMRLRRKVYDAVTTREMEWFDTKMGADDSVMTTEGDGPVGAGGLMAKFTKYVLIFSFIVCTL